VNDKKFVIILNCLTTLSLSRVYRSKCYGIWDFLHEFFDFVETTRNLHYCRGI